MVSGGRSDVITEVLVERCRSNTQFSAMRRHAGFASYSSCGKSPLSSSRRPRTASLRALSRVSATGHRCLSTPIRIVQPHERDKAPHLEGAVYVVVAVQHHLRLDDRHQAGALADGGVTGQAVRSLSHSVRGGPRRDGDDRAPLTEAGTLCRNVYESYSDVRALLLALCELASKT